MWQAHGALFWILTAFYAASWLLLTKAILDAGITLQTGSLGWWAVFRNVRPTYPGMPTRGLFRLCRQPIYLAFTCTVWTVPSGPRTSCPSPAAYGLLHLRPVVQGDALRASFRPAIYRLPENSALLAADLVLCCPLKRNDLSIYDTYAEHWWDGSQRWLRTLQNLVPASLKYFDQVANWPGKNVLDLGCGGGFMSEALAHRGANVIGIYLLLKTIAMRKAMRGLRTLTLAIFLARARSCRWLMRAWTMWFVLT